MGFNFTTEKFLLSRTSEERDQADNIEREAREEKENIRYLVQQQMAEASGSNGDVGKEAAPTKKSRSNSLILPFDLVVEILMRIPAKALVQLRCVCKSWNSLISSDRKFAKKHLDYSQTLENRKHLILVRTNLYSGGERILHLWGCRLNSVFNNNDSQYSQPLDLHYPLLNVQKFHNWLIGSCNGIICFTTASDSSFLLWNPTINKFKILSTFENPHRTGRKVSGFGYDHFTDSYKVVTLFVYRNEQRVPRAQVYVHTLGINSNWRRIQDAEDSILDLPRTGLGFMHSSAKFVSGTINWLVFNPARSSCVILSFDLGNESCQEILHPCDVGKAEGGPFIVTLGVLRDCLCIILSHFDKFWDVWIMKEYGHKDSWTKLFTIPFTLVGYHTPLCAVHYISLDDQLLLNLKEGGGVVVYNSKDATSKIPQLRYVNSYSYTPKKGTSKTSQTSQTPPYKHRRSITDVYVESLISP